MNFQSALIFFLAFAGMFGLGLMNWVELGFAWDRIDEGYLISTLIRVLSYGAIIASMSFHTLMKRKSKSVEYLRKRTRNHEILKYYRPTKLRNYVDRENHRNRKNKFIKTYENELSILEKKRSYYDGVAWKHFIEKMKEGNEPDKSEDMGVSYKDLGFEIKKSRFRFINWLRKRKLNKKEKKTKEYISKRFDYSAKINNPEEFMYKESVVFDELTVQDISVSVGETHNGEDYVPRVKESTFISRGVLKGVVIMFAFNALITAMFFTYEDGGVSAIIHTIITVFLVVLSLFRGIVNGDITFENNTMLKVNFRANHLQAYMVMEAEENDYYIDDFLKKTGQKQVQ